MHNLATTLLHQGRLSEAEVGFLDAIQLQQKVYGPEHPVKLRSLFWLGSVYSGQGRHAEAKGLQIETIQLQKKVMGKAHPQTVETAKHLLKTYQVLGSDAEAERLRQGCSLSDD